MWVRVLVALAMAMASAAGRSRDRVMVWGYGRMACSSFLVHLLVSTGRASLKNLQGREKSAQWRGLRLCRLQTTRSAWNQGQPVNRMLHQDLFPANNSTVLGCPGMGLTSR